MPATLQELEDNAQEAFNNLNDDHPRMLRRAVFSMKKRARACMRNGCGLFEGKKWRIYPELLPKTILQPLVFCCGLLFSVARLFVLVLLYH